MSKQSIATIAEALGKKKGKWEKLAKSSDKIKQNTAKYKLDRINTLFDTLFKLQESMKPSDSKYKYGGNLPKAMYGLPTTWEELLGEKQNGLQKSSYYSDLPSSGKERSLPSFLQKSGEFVKEKWTGIAQGASILGDFINQQAAIKQMEEPNKAAFVPRVTLNKNMDTSAYKRQAIEALRTGYKQTKDLPSNISASVRSNLLSSYLGATGDINTQANNYRSQIENQENIMNQQVYAQNAQILNDLYNRQNMFSNQQTAAKSNAYSNLFNKAQLFAKDLHMEDFQKNHLFPLMLKQFSKPVREYLGFE